MNINWYPGHMKKTKDLLQENIKLVNLIIEVVDAISALGAGTSGTKKRKNL